MDGSLDRRRAMAQRLEEARQQQESLERLGSQLLPDGRRLTDADHDGSLVDVLAALQPVVRRYPDFHLQITTPEGLRLGLYHDDGSLAVEVIEPDQPIDAEAGDLPAAQDEVEAEPARPSSIQLPADDDSALAALLRGQSDQSEKSERR